MLVFITSIRHPRNSNSYLRVIRLLEQSLASVCAQTRPDFRVVVVCNEVPRLSERDRVDYVEVDFPPPSDLQKPTTGMSAIRIDRGAKYTVGLIHARQYSPDYIMFFDADDYISNRIVAFVKNYPRVHGWYFEQGYSYKQGSNRIELIDNFYKLCGTSHIFNQSLFDLPAALSVHSPLDSILSAIDPQYLNNMMGSHRVSRLIYSSRGFDLDRLPFPGAVWVLGNGENHSGLGGNSGNIPLTQDMIDEFQFPGIHRYDGNADE